jgi:hypothetical protein
VRSPHARVAAENQLRALLATRLWLERDRRIPAIAAEVIEQPVFVIGFSRTGTSLLHSLLAQDEGSRAPRWWQTHSPSPPPGEIPVTPQRLADTTRELERFLHKTPGLLTLHPYWDEGAQSLIEDEEIATLDFQNVYPLSDRFPVPATKLVPVADVRRHLPPATPTVSQESRRRQLDERRRQVGRRFNV